MQIFTAIIQAFCIFFGTVEKTNFEQCLQNHPLPECQQQRGIK